MRKLLTLFLFIMVIAPAAGQMLQVQDTNLVIMSVTGDHHRITIPGNQFSRISTIKFTGNDLAVESFTISYQFKGRYFSCYTKYYIKEVIRKSIIDNKVKEVFVNNVKISGQGRTTYTNFVVDITYPQ